MRNALTLSTLLLVTAFGCSSPPIEEPHHSTTSRELAGRIVPEDELATALRNAGFDEATVPKMICTAKYESSFHEEATNSNTNGTTDYGIFQINSTHIGKTSGCPSSSSELLAVDANTQCAFGVFSAQGLNAWVAYKSHKAECDAATAPAADTTDPNADSPDPTTQTDGGTNTNPDGGDDPCWDNPDAPGCNDAGDNGDDPCWDNPDAPGCNDDGDDYDDGYDAKKPIPKQ